MFLNLPKDPVMLLSVINTKLRVDALCDDLGADRAEIAERLGMIDYVYDAGRNQFV